MPSVENGIYRGTLKGGGGGVGGLVITFCYAWSEPGQVRDGLLVLSLILVYVFRFQDKIRWSVGSLSSWGVPREIIDVCGDHHGHGSGAVMSSWKQ